MKPTVSTAVSDRPVAEEGLVEWANREIQPVLNQLRTGANARGIERVSGTTDGAGTYLRVWASVEPPTDAAWHVTATVAAMSSAAGGTERAAYLLGGLVSSIAGAVTLTGSTAVYSFETTGTIDARLGVTGRTAYIEVRDTGGGAMDFVVVVDVTEARFI